MVRSEIGNLRALSRKDIDALLKPESSFDGWVRVMIELERLNLPGMQGYITRGANRVFCYLIHGLKLSSVLEIGNRSGHSTVGLALALKHRTGADRRMVSIDKTDWNDIKNYRRKFGLDCMPQRSLNKVDCASFVEFIVGSSTKVLPKLKQRFDFVFIDGSHRTEIVLADVLNSFRLLNPGGIIVLHDYYPHLKPLWPHRPKISKGPYLAMVEVMKRHPEVHVMSLNDLPWINCWEPSHKTVLAVVARKIGGKNE